MTLGEKPLVKVVGRGCIHHPTGESLLARQLPSQPPEDWPAFTFNPEARDYDWLVVYDNLPPEGGERPSRRVEDLACSPGNTILITSEPCSIKTYDAAFVNQFARIITTQEPDALRHPGRISTLPGLRWFFGVGEKEVRSYDEIAAEPMPEKIDRIGMMSSAKRNTHTRHYDRYHFTQEIPRHIPDIAIFGRGLREIDDKAEAIRPYRYQVVIENHVAPDHITEKPTDAFLGYALPFYFGAPNLADYFPEESFIPIDIQDIEGAAGIMKAAVANREYEKRLPAILEARRRVLEEYNILAIVAREIATERPASFRPPAANGQIASQRAARLKHPFLSALDLARHAHRRTRNHWQRRRERL